MMPGCVFVIVDDFLLVLNDFPTTYFPKFVSPSALVSPKRGAGAGVGVGMLRGGGDSLKLK